MALPDPLAIRPFDGPIDATVRVPGSKSITNRALVCASLADGHSRLGGALFADDTEAMLGVLGSLGVTLQAQPETGAISVDGVAGRPPASWARLDVRQSGTTARFALPLAALGRGTYEVSGHAQMLARPMGPTLDALRDLGIPVEELAGAGRLPVTIRGGTFGEGIVRIAGDVSSQFISGLLLVGPCLPDGLVVEITTPLVSRPYVELTVAVMQAFGASVDSPDPSLFVVAPTGYRAVDYQVEPDASAASYPLAAAVICGGRVTVEGLGEGALQGDAGFADLLGQLGAEVRRDAHGVTVVADGQPGHGSFDLTHMSDTAQTLAAIAVFGDGPTRIEGIGFIRGKETDRVAAIANELQRAGIAAAIEAGGWLIEPGTPRPTTFATYNDHRMAMSLALLGLRSPGIAIADPACVGKTFPGYFDMLEAMRPPSAGR